MRITLDGESIAGEGTILEVCRRRGAVVPALCSDERVAAAGHCRSCLVEVDGRLVAACTTPIAEGMVVTTKSERVDAYRRDLAELLLSESSPRGAAKEWIESVHADGTRYAKLPHDPSAVPDESHPYVRIDLAACIRCRLCVRACSEMQGQFVLAMAGRGSRTHVTWGGGEFDATQCVACGACASACPSDAISDVDRGALESDSSPERAVATTCGYCGVGCQLIVHANGDAIARIEGRNVEPNHGHLCVKGRYAHAFVRHSERLTTPLLRKGDQFEPISWDAALAIVAREFVRLRGSIAALSSSRCTNEENYLVQKWFRAGLGTNDVDCCARVCHAPSAAGMRRVLGTGAATNSYADIDRADLLWLCGTNATESHPVIGARVKQAVLRGAKLVVVDPRRTELAQIADVHLQPRPGTNVPLLQSVAAVIVEEELFDRAYIEARTTGFAEYREFVLRSLPEATESITRVPARLVRNAARLYAAAGSPMQLHGLGMTEHVQGSEGVMLLCNLALLVGAIGREGVGVNPLRGQNNVQGAADMGCQPDLLPGYAAVTDPSVRARFEGVWGRTTRATAGRTIPRMYDAIESGELRGLYVLGEDVVETDPDSHRVRACLARLEFLVVQELFMTSTARLAHLVLPGASFFEKDGTFTSGERRLSRVREVIPPRGESRADWRILLDLMRATGFPQSFDSPRAIFDEIATLVPQFAAVNYDAIEDHGVQWPATAEAPSGTAVLHRESFAIGRAPFQCVPYLPTTSVVTAAAPLLLVTGRVLEHYNNGSMTRRTGNKELVPHDVLEIHPQDAFARDVVDGDVVIVKSSFGEATAVANHSLRVEPGTVFLSFHFPATGTNQVTTNVVDRIAECPEYKLTPVEVRRNATSA